MHLLVKKALFVSLIAAFVNTLSFNVMAHEHTKGHKKVKSALNA
jgi:hypothetical protein